MYAGGSVELDEAVEDCAKRELFEETGLMAGELRLLGVFSGKDLHYVYPNGDEVSNIDIVYVCADCRGEMKCQEGEFEELRFFDADALPENIFPPLLRPIEAWIRQRTKR